MARYDADPLTRPQPLDEPVRAVVLRDLRQPDHRERLAHGLLGRYGHSCALASTTQVTSTVSRSRRWATSRDFDAMRSVARRLPRPTS